jgi:hypothetical protein
MSVYANLFRFDMDSHQVRLIFFDQRKTYDRATALQGYPEANEVADVVMTRQSFHALMEIINMQMAPNLPPLAVPGQPYPPVFAGSPEDRSWQGKAGSGGDREE